MKVLEDGGRRLWPIYHEEVPEVIARLARTEAMRRLQRVGMSCGGEYVALHEKDMDVSRRYTRFSHSVGVALIVWHFTHDEKQAIAGLFHDISTPAFAHVVDYMNGDHMKQESTEEKTAAFIDGSEEIQAVLCERGLRTADVCDYHRYPIADNDSPRLSADRLEYTFGSCLRYFVTDIPPLADFYGDLQIGKNEEDTPELVFAHQDVAEAFACCAARCSEVYVSDSDRFTMQYLADLLKSAAAWGVLTVDDLYTTEEFVIGRLLSDTRTAKGWQDYCGIRAVARAVQPVAGQYCVQVNAKRRYIDPLTAHGGRVTAFSEPYRAWAEALRQREMTEWLTAKI